MKDTENISEKKRDFELRGDWQEGLDYFFQMAMMLRLENRQDKKTLVACQEKLKTAELEGRSNKK